jgi:hypothetical protein
VESGSWYWMSPFAILVKVPVSSVSSLMTLGSSGAWRSVRRSECCRRPLRSVWLALLWRGKLEEDPSEEWEDRLPHVSVFRLYYSASGEGNAEWEKREQSVPKQPLVRQWAEQRLE